MTLVRAIQSVLTQNFDALELIIVDDGSTDGTAELVATIADPRLRYIRLENNAGASRARNVGMRAARGEFVAFQDSDDEWLYGKLQQQVAAARKAGEADVAVFHAKIIQGIDNHHRYGRNHLSYVPIFAGGHPPNDLVRVIHERNVISPQTLLFSRSCLEKIGYFDECLANSVDWDFAIRLIHNVEVIFLDDPLVMTYTQPDSISRNRRRALRSQLRVMLKLDRNYDVHPKVLGRHFGLIGMALSKAGHPARGRKLLRRSLRFDRFNIKNWLRLAATELIALRS